MPQKPIPFVNQQESSSEELAGASPLALNVVVDRKGCVMRRPGVKKLYTLAEAPIVGLYETNQGMRVAVAGLPPNRSLYRLGAANGTVLAASSSAGRVYGPGRPIFSETESLLVIAAGATIMKMVLATQECSPLGGSPPNSSHVCFNSSRLLANDVTVNLSAIRFSDEDIASTYAGFETWQYTGLIGGPGYVLANANPDPVIALFENSNEVFAFGTSTVQHFAPDVTYTFSSVVTQTYGVSAPYSIARTDGGFAWLDHLRRFVASDGRDAKPFGDAIQHSVEGIDPTGCYGYRVKTGDVDCLVWTFPSTSQTFAYQMGGGWGQWNYTDVVTSVIQIDGETVVGTESGVYGTMSVDNATDDGAPIVAYVCTGYIDRETSGWKDCKHVTFTVKRGQSAEPGRAQVWFRDREGPWEGPLPIDFGSIGETESTVTFDSLGMYRRRQWKFEFDGSEPLKLVSASEEYEVQS